jgi:uncharacterized protein
MPETTSATQNAPSPPAADAVRPLRMVLPGGTGHVGGILARHFHSLGYAVTVLSRRRVSAPWTVVSWDGVHLGDWVHTLEGADVVVNLAGRSVDCRYDASHRREILDSRIGSTRVLGRAIHQLTHPPRLWMNASTATIYRDSYDRAMDEAAGEIGGNEASAPSTWRFSIDVAKRWEECFFVADTPGTRKIAIRAAMIMSPEPGGAFAALLNLVRFGFGGACGSGRQFVSWVHEADFVRAIEHVMLSQRVAGIVNVTAPSPLPNADFMRALRQAWGRRIAFPIARWMLEAGAIVLRTESELVLKSRRVVPGRLLEDGFAFHFPEWPAAAGDLVQRWRDKSRRESGAGATSRVGPQPGAPEFGAGNTK